MADKKNAPIPDFEQSIEQLEGLIDLMEKGDLSLDESLTHYEKGVQLTRQCQQALDLAQQKVDDLMNDTTTLDDGDDD